MKTKKINVATLALFIFTVVGCAKGPMAVTWDDPKGDKDSRSSEQDLGLNPAYEAKALEILKVSCVSCHNSSQGFGGVSDLENASNIVQSGLIIPGQAAQSPIFQEIEMGFMPPDSHLAPEDIQTIAMWIGSPNTVPPSTTTTTTIFTTTTTVHSPSPTPTSTTTSTTTTTTLPPAGPTATFAYIQKTILTPKCVRCHSASFAEKGYAFDTYTATLKSVKINNPTGSKLYSEIKKGSMPPRPSPAIPSDEAALILSWITNGAKNN